MASKVNIPRLIAETINQIEPVLRYLESFSSWLKKKKFYSLPFNRHASDMK
jgi:hypothetical protein